MDKERGENLLTDAFAKKHDTLEQQAQKTGDLEKLLRQRLAPLRENWAAHRVFLNQSGADDGTSVPPAERERNRNELSLIEAALGTLPKAHQEKVEVLNQLLRRIKKLEAMLLPDAVEKN